MSQKLTTEAMALPMEERVQLAQALWQSIDGELLDTSESEAIQVSVQRDQELSSGAVTGHTHEEIMQEWHGDILNERHERLNSGEESLSDWEAAKAEIRKRTTGGIKPPAEQPSAERPSDAVEIFRP